MLVALASGGGLASLLVAALQRIESLTFWAFCFFEACIGIYFPSMGAQWAMVIDDRARAEIYNILRIPLNIFAVVLPQPLKEIHIMIRFLSAVQDCSYYRA